MLQQVHSPQEQEEEVKQLIGLLQRGTLLPTFVHYEWFGNIKINHDELFIRIIEKLLPIVEANNEPRKVIVLSDVLFSFDGMSETALTFKIKALKKLGQKRMHKVFMTVSKRSTSNSMERSIRRIR